ncbi:MAG: FG-GAP-like repeat-containing protein [Vicinamibacterales bacterium]
MFERQRLCVLLAACLTTSPALAFDGLAPLASQTFVTGLSSPVAFVQDPTDAYRQMVVEQGGHVRVVLNQVLLTAPFLDLSAVISSDGERGLLGMAFAPDYAASGRFYVNFTNAAGHTVIARFKRSSGNAAIADPSSRFDLRWGGSTGTRFIAQPYSNHNGGDLHFGPDGFLYIGMGDGGSGGDPQGRAQNPNTLLGKMLRIDVNVSDAHSEGYVVPASNPFLPGSGPIVALPEIWAFGLRNPWRFSFDSPGSGALIIGDVGQGAWEEVDYQPAGVGGLNYGWRNYEGNHLYDNSTPAAYGPLTFPAAEYDHSLGRSITGGVVCHQCIANGSFEGRYFFADFITGRVWSVRFTPGTDGRMIAADQIEHTAEISGGRLSLGNVSAMAIAGPFEQLFIVLYDQGTIVKVSGRTPARMLTYGTHFSGAGANLALYRPDSGNWLCDCGPLDAWGRAGDVPVPGYYRPVVPGRSVYTTAVFRPATGEWFLHDTPPIAWGAPGDVPVPGRYRGGDLFTDIAVFRPSSGTWFVKDRFTVIWGAPGDVPVPTDYNGDGRDDVAVYRPSNGTWYVRDGVTVEWGLPGDIPVPADYDADGSADIAVFRPSTGQWLVRGYLTRVWGRAGDIPVPLDLDGDAHAELVVFRPSNATWYAIDVQTGATRTVPIGRPGDVPLGRVAPPPSPHAGDADGDGRADLTVFRPSTAEWLSLRSSSGGSAFSRIAFGLSTDTPVAHDYDGDGILDPAVYRPGSPGTWSALLSSSGFQTISTSAWGVTGDLTVPADYDGDGRTDIAVWRPSDGRWYVLLSSTGQGLSVDWGLNGDVPAPADFDGDGRADFAVFRPSTGRWYVRGIYTGATLISDWGMSGDVPVPADYDGDGRADVAVFRPSTGTWWIRIAATSAILTIDWGLSGDIAGPFDFDGDRRADVAVYRPSTGRWYGRGLFTRDWGAPGDVPVVR